MRVDLPGVGRNLQDRYEIGVVNRMSRPGASWTARVSTAATGCIGEWSRPATGMYISNGAALALSLRSAPDCRVPDLFCMALLANFQGYFPGYSRVIAEHHDYLTWAVLKAHTNNRAGEVTLRSADPRDTPAVNFRYFEEGSDDAGDDLKAVVTASRFVRRMTHELKRVGLIQQEELPGDAVQTDEQLAEYVRDNAWGHHASCTCAIGPREAEWRARQPAARARHRAVCASSMPRCSRAFPASSSSARCTWWRRRRRT